MRNKSLLYLEADKSNENLMYFIFIFDIRINGKTTLNGKKNDFFKKKILKIKRNGEEGLFEQFMEEFSTIKTKYFMDENGTPFVPNFFIETNSEEMMEDWNADSKSSEGDIFKEYLSSCILTKKDFKFENVEEMFDYLKD